MLKTCKNFVKNAHGGESLGPLDDIGCDEYQNIGHSKQRLKVEGGTLPFIRQYKRAMYLYWVYIYIYLYVWKQSAIKRVNRVAAVDTYLGKPAGRRTGVEFLEFLGITKCSSNQLHFSKWMASAADAETLSQSWSRSASPVVDPCNSFH